MKTKLSVMTAALLMSNLVLATPVSQNSAKLIFTQLLRHSPAVNSGDGAVEKSGTITCYQMGKRAPFSYRCGLSKSTSAAQEIYLKGLSEVAAIDNGDGVVEKTAFVSCFELGFAAPYQYLCQFN